MNEARDKSTTSPPSRWGWLKGSEMPEPQDKYGRPRAYTPTTILNPETIPTNWSKATFWLLFVVLVVVPVLATLIVISRIN